MKLQAVLLILLFLSASPQPVAVIETVDAMCLCKFVAPRYSVIARQALIQGSVRLKIEVEPNGTTGGITILEQANPILGESAAAAAKNWRFCYPLTKNSPNERIVTFNFKLEGKATEHWAPTDVHFDAPNTVTVTTPSAATLQY